MVKKASPETTPSLETDSAALPAAAVAELPYVQIQYASHNNLLYPIDAENGTLAMISVANMQAAPVTLFWAIKGQAEPAFEPIEVPGRTDGNVEIPIPWERVSTCIGKTVLIWYTATVAGRLQESLVLELEIQDVREADLRMSLPVFMHSRLEWSTWWLNMYEFQGDETIQIKAWPMIQAGQRLFVTVAGDQHRLPYQFIWVAYDHVVTAAEAHADHLFEFRLARGWMSRREDYSALTTHMGVIWDGTAPVLPVPDDLVHENPLPLNAQDFHLRTTTLLRVDPALDLPPPHLKESTELNGHWVVNPNNTLNGAHTVIVYDGMHAGDRVCPSFAGTPGLGSPPIECRIVQEGESSLEFWVPRSAISANFARSITLTYTVSHSGTGPWQSPPREVSILNIIGLPVPVVPEATPPATQSGILDLRTFAGDAHITVEKWWFILAGQRGWLQVDGTRENGSTYVIRVMMAELITEEDVENGLRRVLLRSELEQLRNLTPLVVTFGCTPDGSPSPGQEIVFPVLNLVFAKPFYHHTDFNPAGNGWHGWQRGAGATDSRDLTLKQGAVPGASNGYYLADWGYTNTTNPLTQREKLYQNFTALQPGRRYSFSAWVRDSHPPGTGRKPELVLVVQSNEITSRVRPESIWQLLEGTFQADSNSMRLSLDNLQMGIDPVNDFDVTGITVQEV
jgi:hypothetical protein